MKINSFRKIQQEDEILPRLIPCSPKPNNEHVSRVSATILVDSQALLHTANKNLLTFSDLRQGQRSHMIRWQTGPCFALVLLHLRAAAPFSRNHQNSHLLDRYTCLVLLSGHLLLCHSLVSSLNSQQCHFHLINNWNLTPCPNTSIITFNALLIFIRFAVSFTLVTAFSSWSIYLFAPSTSTHQISAIETNVAWYTGTITI